MTTNIQLDSPDNYRDFQKQNDTFLQKEHNNKNSTGFSSFHLLLNKKRSYLMLLLIICPFCSSKAYAQNNTIFNGGNADGFSVSCYAQADAVLNNTIFNGGNSDGFFVSCYIQADAALPIELLSFTGKCDNKNLIFKWSTATEINNHYFTIEHSKDGINWIIRGTVNGAGNSSSLLNYSFTDTEPNNGISYYRLKQTDFDGNSKYATIITVQNCKEDLPENSLIIYPNPGNGTFNLLFNGDKAQVHSIEIYNVSGERVYYSGSYQPIIDLTGKPSGTYFVHFNSHIKIITKKIVIVR